MWGHRAKAAIGKSGRASGESKLLISCLDFGSPELWEREFLLQEPPSLGYFVRAALANQYRSRGPLMTFQLCLRLYVVLVGQTFLSIQKPRQWISRTFLDMLDSLISTGLREARLSCCWHWSRRGRWRRFQEPQDNILLLRRSCLGLCPSTAGAPEKSSQFRQWTSPIT